VHEDQDPKGSVPDLSAVAGYAPALFQFAIAATQAGDLIVATTDLTGTRGTILEPVPIKPGPIASGGAITGFLAFGGYNVFIAMEDGTLRYLTKEPFDQRGSWSDRGALNIGSGRRIVGLASYVAERDGYGHVIAACDDGDVLDLRVSPDPTMAEPTFLDVRASIPNPIAVAGYFGPDDYHHIYVASKDGNIHEIWFPGVATSGQGGVSVRAQFSGVFAIAAYPIASEGRHYVVAATRILAASWRGF
jgi:hypothetical protein